MDYNYCCPIKKHPRQTSLIFYNSFGWLFFYSEFQNFKKNLRIIKKLLFPSFFLCRFLIFPYLYIQFITIARPITHDAKRKIDSHPRTRTDIFTLQILPTINIIN